MRTCRLPKCSVFLFASLLAAGVHAMTINPNGTGQVLIYPYYTVNKHQQTIFTVSNPTTNAKAVQITFREGYDGKVVYAIDVFLAAFSSWNANVFAPQDAGKTGDGAAIVSFDTSCTHAIIDTPPTSPSPGFPYDNFSSIFFTGSVNDGGPSDDARQREGFIEAIEMAEIHGVTLAAISASDGQLDCTKVSPTVANPSDFTRPTGGLTGAAAVIDVAQGTYFVFEPHAIDDFRTEAVVPPTAVQLTDAGSSTSDTVAASIAYRGSVVTLTFPQAQAINAVSALFMADTVYGELDQSPNLGAGTDWVLTFPTKEFYVNVPQAAGLGPFENPFDNGGSAVNTSYDIFFRDGSNQGGNWCGFNECPPLGPAIRYQTQVITFLPQTDPPSAVLGSTLLTPAPAGGLPAAAQFMFNDVLDASNEGYVLRGSPVFGVQAINYVNSNVTAGVLSNYSGTAALRTTVSCTKNGAACP